MADRIIRGGQQGLLLYTRNLHFLRACFRNYGSQNPGDSHEGSRNKGENSSDSPHYWLDINRGLFGPKDSRFPLPGDLGTGTDQLNKAPVAEISDMSKDIENVYGRKDATKLLTRIVVANNILYKYEQQIKKEQNSLKKLKELVSMQIHDIDGECSLAEDKESFCIKIRDICGCEDNQELFIINCSEFLASQFQDLFPRRRLSDGGLTAVIYSFKTKHNMSVWSDEMEDERDFFNDKAIEEGTKVCEAFEKDGYWADFVDPSSGRPFRGDYTNATLFETDHRFRYLGLSIDDLGCCKALNHAVFGHNVFSYVLFTNAPVNIKFLMGLSQKLPTESKDHCE